MSEIGKYVMIFGGFLLVIGLVLYFFGNHLNWLGKLPGDIRIEKESYRFYFPLTTMILVSVLLTIIINLIRKIF